MYGIANCTFKVEIDGNGQTFAPTEQSGLIFETFDLDPDIHSINLSAATYFAPGQSLAFDRAILSNLVDTT